MFLLVVATFLALLIPVLTLGAFLSDLWRARNAVRSRRERKWPKAAPRQGE
jgi:hypothetical protein